MLLLNLFTHYKTNSFKLISFIKNVGFYGKEKESKKKKERKYNYIFN